MSNTSIPSISPSEQKNIISSAKTSVGICVGNYADRTGFKHVFTKEDIEDIIGNTVYKACHSFASFDGNKAKLSTWVNRIAVNCVRDAIHYRMKRRNISCELIEENSESGEEFSLDEVRCKSQEDYFEGWARFSSEAADNELLSKDFKAYLMNCPGMSERDRKFAQWLLDGFTVQEMAAMDGCSPNAASKRIWEIRRAYRRSGVVFSDGSLIFGMKAAC